MKITTINTPIVICPFSKHIELKESILDEINSSPAENIRTKQGSNITRCDWGIVNLRREWVKDLLPVLQPEIDQIYKNLGYNYTNIYNIWFQQYTVGSFHNWHVHTECQWTNVYYLELPADSPKTEVFDIVTKKTIALDVKEGDLCCFPSYVIHRAPMNNSNKTKTIISFNSGVDIDGSYYNET